jgi:hypothetical protein
MYAELFFVLKSKPAYMNNKKTLAILNLLGFILTIVLNGLANALPINGKTTGELSDAYPNLFVPAGFTFSIWAVIYLALLAFVIYQLKEAFSAKSETNGFISKIGIFFFLSSLANSSWIVAWHYQYVALSLLIMLCIFFTLLQIYQRLQIGLVSVSKTEKWLVHVPFSIYLGWITVATIANTTALLVDLDWNGFGVAPEIWATIVIVVGALIGSRVVQDRKDVAYGLVIVWAYYGIISKRMSIDADLYQNIIITAIAGIILVVGTMIMRLLKKNQN